MHVHNFQSIKISNTQNYYLGGNNVTIHNDTEGKVPGPFILAGLEYEKTDNIKYNKKKCFLFGKKENKINYKQ